MPSHKNIDFENLHKARLQVGTEAELPLAPEGLGDLYWAYNTQKMFIANADGDDWEEFEFGGGTPTLDLNDIQDVETSGVTNGQALTWVTANNRWENTTISSALAGLTDVILSSVNKGHILVYRSGAWRNLAPGTDGQVLTALAAATNGITWADPPVGDDYIEIDNLSGDPTGDPSSGKAWIYVKSSGLYIQTSTGTVIGPFSTVVTLNDLTDVTITSGAKGDILARTTTGYVNLAVGTNGQSLIADSGETTGMRWGSPTAADEDLRILTWMGL